MDTVAAKPITVYYTDYKPFEPVNKTRTFRNEDLLGKWLDLNAGDIEVRAYSE